MNIFRISIDYTYNILKINKILNILGLIGGGHSKAKLNKGVTPIGIKIVVIFANFSIVVIFANFWGGGEGARA